VTLSGAGHGTASFGCWDDIFADGDPVDRS
jgi:hypothetical protein